MKKTRSILLTAAFVLGSLSAANAITITNNTDHSIRAALHFGDSLIIEIIPSNSTRIWKEKSMGEENELRDVNVHFSEPTGNKLFLAWWKSVWSGSYHNKNCKLTITTDENSYSTHVSESPECITAQAQTEIIPVTE